MPNPEAIAAEVAAEEVQVIRNALPETVERYIKMAVWRGIVRFMRAELEEQRKELVG